MDIVSLTVSRNITPYTCRQVYWLYHTNSFVYTPVLNPTFSVCIKLAGLPSSTKLGVRSRKQRAVQCTCTKKHDFIPQHRPRQAIRISVGTKAATQLQPCGNWVWQFSTTLCAQSLCFETGFGSFTGRLGQCSSGRVREQESPYPSPKLNPSLKAHSLPLYGLQFEVT
jgi:hypothetical protein